MSFLVFKMKGKIHILFPTPCPHCFILWLKCLLLDMDTLSERQRETDRERGSIDNNQQYIYKRETYNTCQLFKVSSSVNMEDSLMFFTFLTCMMVCNSICFILHKYQKTITAVNQNIINNLSYFSIFCLNLLNSFQGLCIMWRSSVGPFNVTVAVVVRYHTYLTLSFKMGTNHAGHQYYIQK